MITGALLAVLDAACTALANGADRDPRAVAVIPVGEDRDAGSACVSNDCLPARPAPARPVCTKRRKNVAGDFNGDGLGDIALTGGFSPGESVPWRSIPVAFSKGNGMFVVTNSGTRDFPLFATQAGAQPLGGDVDGDGRWDLLLTGGRTPAGDPWGTLPVAWSRGSGLFVTTNDPLSEFGSLASEPGTVALSGDFDGDGKWDVAVLDKHGSGAMALTDTVRGGFSSRAIETAWSTGPLGAGARALAGDFDGDGRHDIALVGAGSAEGLLVAFSKDGGTFRAVEARAPGLLARASDPGALAVVGDFDADGRDDIALVGGASWTDLVLVYARAEGVFEVVFAAEPELAARAVGARFLVSTDVDGDGCSDLALVGRSAGATGGAWDEITVALSNPGGGFRLTRESVPEFSVYATQPSAKAVSASAARR